MINYQDFSYNGSRITFSFETEVYVNATKKAKAFGKVPAKWLELSSTKEFLTALSNIRFLDITRLLITKQGFSINGGGTCFHEDVAIEFARWLSPLFAIWCNDCIKKLITNGKVEVKRDMSEPIPMPMISRRFQRARLKR